MATSDVLSEADLLRILEQDGWFEIELDLFLRKGMTLEDLHVLLERAAS